MTLPLPRYVIAKPLASGATAFYFNIPTRYRKLGCRIPNEPLGNDYAAACGVDGAAGRAAALNALFDEWAKAKSGENVLAGYVRWTDYRSRGADNAIRIEHHKTAAVVLHPLETMEGGERVQFYADAESVLAQVPRRGVPMILKPKRDGTAEPYTAMMMAKVVRKVREAAKLPPWFTLDSCRHGGMTELEEAELTDGQGRALSGHRSKAYEGYAKRTFERALAATRKRHAHRLANAQGTTVQNGTREGVQNEIDRDDTAIA